MRKTYLFQIIRRARIVHESAARVRPAMHMLGDIDVLIVV